MRIFHNYVKHHRVYIYYIIYIHNSYYTQCTHVYTLYTPVTHCYTMHTIKRYNILYMCTLYHNILTHYININLYYAKQNLNIHLTIVAETTLLPKQVSVRCAIQQSRRTWKMEFSATKCQWFQYVYDSNIFKYY